ncbi:SRBD1 [Branchiostoma lanceolatum]|uniref:SRBD1 protein n=1 Tax=Branchiostoma lanceolatum TaxID=7740 RepID=A0A8J9ZXP4_BRALA|nr:SRBD1 [Branchiostoma lanceolatum]
MMAQKKMANAKQGEKPPTSAGVSMLWEAAHVLSDRLDIYDYIAANVIELLDEGCTVPFIARYRKEKTDNMEAEKLREVQAAYEELKGVQLKACNVVKQVEKQGKMTDGLLAAVRRSTTIEELEHLYAPYKVGSKATLAERARQLGLEPAAVGLLSQPHTYRPQQLVRPGEEGRQSPEEVDKGVQHIIADIVSKDKETMDTIRAMCKAGHVKLESTKSKSTAKKEKEQENATHKFEQYYTFSCPIKYIKPHQVLAINRGESQKILSVKINIPDDVKTRFLAFCERRWIPRNAPQHAAGVIMKAVEDAYSRLIQPLMIRHYRADLTKTAEKQSAAVFSHNLQRLLLQPPVRGRVVLGVDPGYRHGCKLAVTSQTGQILHTDVVYLHDNRAVREAERVKRILLNHRCQTVAIGNGTACRETEAFFSQHIQQGTFRPLDVVYCIVNESGASIYSVSDEAKKEMPDLDPNLRSAVSIARRLQDPLVELVKIEPKNIGVGMYQHDISESMLKAALDGVVEECVSFVGVDINVCSETLLRRLAGLNANRAKKLVEWREANGSFINREQLRSVKGLGPKTFEQCAGFIRINPISINSSAKSTTEEEQSTNTAQGKKRKAAAEPKKRTKKAKTEANLTLNPLDMTCIHPESYSIALQFLNRIGGSLDELGQQNMRTKVQAALMKNNVEMLSADLKCGTPTMQLIIDGLQQPLDYDIRAEFEKPLFKKGLVSMNNLKAGTTLTGRVTNLTDFGAFVDIGVGKDGLIHKSKIRPDRLKGKKSLGPGDKVEVKVLNVDPSRGRIGLELLTLIS